jgi:hypothetical protein
MGLFKNGELKEKVIKTAKPRVAKSTLKVKNDPSKGASFWVVDTKNETETLLFSGTISECRDYIYLASKNLIM